MTAQSSSKVVVINSQKGGQGKSTVAMNVANELDYNGHNVLLMDLDPSGHLSNFLDYRDVYKSGPPDLYSVVFQDQTNADLGDLIYPTPHGFDFLPATDRLPRLETDIWNYTDKPLDTLVPLFNHLRRHYDFVLLDTAPTKSRLLACLLHAADQTIIPSRVGDAHSVIKNTIDDTLYDFQQNGVDGNRPVNDVGVLAIVPTFIASRIDHDNDARTLIKNLSASSTTDDAVPNFAYIPPAHFAAVDHENLSKLPRPGIRKATALSEETPLRAVDDSHGQLECFRELAAIVEQEGVARDLSQTPLGKVVDNVHQYDEEYRKRVRGGPEQTAEAMTGSFDRKDRRPAAADESETNEDHTRSL